MTAKFADIAWLSDPEVFAVNRKAAHSDHDYYETMSQAQKWGKMPLRQSLNGTWRFAYAPNPSLRVKDFYKLDFSELPVLLCGFYLGPSAAVACEGVKILLKLLLKGTSTAFVGDFANFAVGCSFVLPAIILYHLKKTRKGALMGLLVGTAVLSLFGSAFNAIYLLPKFAQLYGLPMDNIIAMGSAVNAGVTDVATFVILCVAPLNVVKGLSVSVLTLLLYKRVEKAIFNRSR